MLYNPVHDILEFCEVLVQVPFLTSETVLDVLCLHVESCFSALFYVICASAAERSVISIISS